ncbi:MAG: arylsulfotransferase family protein, partial [SAR324 cluster bacterium]|nr:arylsulfotransferase family protein [SAR324 cluster bacterium]
AAVSSKGFLAFGPYVTLTPGLYKAEYLLKISAPLGSTVGFIDVSINQEPINRREIKGTADKLETLTLTFEVTEENQGKVETRLFLDENVGANLKYVKIDYANPPKKRKFKEVLFGNKNTRRQNPEVFVSKNSPLKKGYFAILAATDGKDGVHGIFILNGAGKLVRTIPINDSEPDLKGKIEKKNKYLPIENRFPHGFYISKNGDILFNDGDFGNTIRKIDWCGNKIWTQVAQTHHSIEVHEGLIYTWEGYGIAVKDEVTGAQKKMILLKTIFARNEEFGVFNTHVVIASGQYHVKDPTHQNDVEPLPLKYAKAFPMFNPGDLLISIRNLNLIAVIDKDTLKMKWWNQGLTTRQHDPDWQADGTISIYNNKYGRYPNLSFSEIVSINPKDSSYKIIYSGARDRAYSRMRGKHQVLKDGSILMTMTQQGRVLAVDKNKKVVFEFINHYQEKSNLVVSEAIYLEPGYLDFNPRKETCTQK